MVSKMQRACSTSSGQQLFHYQVRKSAMQMCNRMVTMDGGDIDMLFHLLLLKILLPRRLTSLYLSAMPQIENSCLIKQN